MQLDIKKNGLCIILAREFNRELSKTPYSCARLFLINVFLFKCGDDLFMLEGFLEGNYEKYGNNLNYLDPEKETRHLTAFAHFFYDRTNGNYMITDFQGVGGYLLTDPVLHSKS